jgi:hypothetical protein
MGVFAVHKVPPGFSAHIVHSMASPARMCSKDAANPSDPAAADGERCARVLPSFLGSARMAQMKQDEIWAHGIIWDTVCAYRPCNGRSAIEKGSMSCMPPPSPSEPKDCNAVLRENLLYELPRLLFLALPEESLVPRISDVLSGRYDILFFFGALHAQTHTRTHKKFLAGLAPLESLCPTISSQDATLPVSQTPLRKAAWSRVPPSQLVW